MKLPRLTYKMTGIFVLVCPILGELLAWVSGMPYWGATLIVALATLVNELIATAEDRATRGLLNDDDERR